MNAPNLKHSAIAFAIFGSSLTSVAIAETPAWCNAESLNPTEQTICNDVTLSKADSLMTQVYRTLLAQPKQAGEESLGPSEIISDQREWINQRNQLVEKSDLLDAYTARIQALTNVLVRTW